jgi:hypothetical protein
VLATNAMRYSGDRASDFPILNGLETWAYLARFEHAEALARTNTMPANQMQALTQLVTAPAQAGLLDRAEALARTINDPGKQARALTELAVVAAKAGTPTAPPGWSPTPRLSPAPPARTPRYRRSPNWPRNRPGWQPGPRPAPASAGAQRGAAADRLVDRNTFAFLPICYQRHPGRVSGAYTTGMCDLSDVRIRRRQRDQL